MQNNEKFTLLNDEINQHNDKNGKNVLCIIKSKLQRKKGK